MLNKDELINQIVEAEWKMFHEVPNIGGKASCQEDYRTFRINRVSQAINWSQEALQSYLDDLAEAEKKERNLLTEKYARMMESTSPLEYSQMKKLLPSLSSEAKQLIEEIIKVVLSWEESIKVKYPYIAKRGRPIYSAEDTGFVTSIETYLRGELSTFSLKTLRLYFESVSRQNSDKVNGSEVTLAYMMKQYGFNSIEEANEKFALSI